MFYRKIINDIYKWKESLKIKKRALVIKGLRQIGKTTTLLDFCNKNYENVIYINFMDNKSIKKVFDSDTVIDNIIRDLSAALPGVRFVPEKTVIFFDEIQECSNARSSIKAFMLDGRFDIVCSGSLIGLRGYNKKKSKGVPTGFEYPLTMYPMDFEEYLLAKGVASDVIEYLKECFLTRTKVSEALNDTIMSYFKEYLCVGGMPDVVNTFFKTYDVNQVNIIQKSILEEFKDDFGKHLDEEELEYINQAELTKIMQVYDSIPSQLAKENKKFQYSVISKKAKGRDYEFAIEWLEEFGLIKKAYNLNTLELPLKGNKDESSFKVYVQDTGLLIAMLDEGVYDNILNGDLKIYKGAIFENIVADSLIKNNKDLYYYQKNSGLKLDFVINHNNNLYPVEVKATNGNAKSLKEVITNKDKYNINMGFKLIEGNIGLNNNNNILTLPLYMALML